MLMIAALYGTGMRPGDRFFCPSSPAWGHGLWHGTLAPLALGVTTGAFAGNFDAVRLHRSVGDPENHQSFGRRHAFSDDEQFRRGRAVQLLDAENVLHRRADRPGYAELHRRVFRAIRLCSMYGTTEIGVVLVNYPGAPDFRSSTARSASRAGHEVEVQRPRRQRLRPGREVGEIMVWRKGEWLATKDLGRIDADGYFYHGGRADDVIISAGWTMSAVEIEQTPAATTRRWTRPPSIGVPDGVRGQVVKAFIVTTAGTGRGHVNELQEFTREQLSQHEYPRQSHSSGTAEDPGRKVNRKVLRDREAAKIN